MTKKTKKERSYFPSTIELIGRAGTSGHDQIAGTALLELSTRDDVVLTKIIIDTIMDTLVETYGKHKAIDILWDILSCKQAFGIVGKAYLNAPMTCRVSTPFGPSIINLDTAKTSWNTDDYRHNIIEITHPDTDVLIKYISKNCIGRALPNEDN